MSERVTIGICTKDRWEDLATTLKMIRHRHTGVRILVIDDGSSTPAPSSVLQHLDAGDFIADGTNRGYIERRNQIASLADSEYYLSLDDDSYIVDGSLDAAVEFADRTPNLLCLGFPVRNARGDSEVPPQSCPREVRHFIGCAHLMNVGRFRGLGGYRAELVHQGEESEIAARALREGLSCWQYPGVTVLHNYSLTGRNWNRMDFYGARNRYLWNDWFAPLSVRRGRQMRLLTERLILAVKTGRGGHLRGWLAGRRDARRLQHLRHTFDDSTFARWNSMPTW